MRGSCTTSGPICRPSLPSAPWLLHAWCWTNTRIDELYGAVFIQPLIALSTTVFWKGIDRGLIDGAVDERRSRSAGRFRRHAPHAVGQHSLLCGMGGRRRGCGDRVHGVARCAMNYIDGNILTIVTFLPLAGAILLVFFPAPRPRRALLRARHFADHAACLAASAVAFRPRQQRLPVRAERPLDPPSQHSLPPRG